MELPFKKVLTFEYLVLQVKKRNWREFLKMTTRLELNPAKMQLVTTQGVIENHGDLYFVEAKRNRERHEIRRALGKTIDGAQVVG